MNVFLLSAISHTIITALAFVFFPCSLPPLVVLLGLQFFAFITGLFPVIGFPHFTVLPSRIGFALSYIHHIFILGLANLIIGVGASLRMTRTLMLDQVGQPYIVSLRSRGIPERRVFFVHAFRNALNPFIPWTGVQIAGLFGGTIMLETIFAYPGVGLLMVQAVLEQDVNLLMANLLVVSATVMVAVLLADILLALLDPRVKYGER